MKLKFRRKEREVHLAALGWNYVATPHFKCSIQHVETAQPINIHWKADAQQLLDHLWTKEIWANIEEMTQCSPEGQGKKLITGEEICRYFGMIAIFSIYNCCDIKQYFHEGEGTINYPGKQNALGQSRFFNIGKHLRFHITTLHKLLHQSFSAHLIPGTYLTVNEIRIKCYKEGCPFIHYNPLKADKQALESLSLHDQSGYLLAFTHPCEDITPYKALLSLCGTVRRSGRAHHIMADRKFSSVHQAETLDARGFYFTLACQADRPK